MSNYPFSYKLSWPLRFAMPSLGGDASGFAPATGVLSLPPIRSVRLAFVGDISAVANKRPPNCDEALRQLLASADLVVGNCESPVVDKPSARFGTWLGTHHQMSAAFLGEALHAAGMQPGRTVLSLANNHMLDQGSEGYAATLSALETLGIASIGIEPTITNLQAGPLTVGLVAFTQWRNAPESHFAGRVVMASDFPAGGGVVPGEGTDIVCAVPHWDWEFRHFPRPETRAWARRLSELGVGLIAGHHAHVVQPVERIGETLVAYGLGDFLGTALARQPWPGRIGAILIVEVSADEGSRGRIASYSAVPFMRMREGDGERLVPLDAVDGAIGLKARRRWHAIFAGAADFAS
nr:CapA family protein [Aminobacter sp. HY435]